MSVKPHFHKTESGLVKCYHETKSLFATPSFWIGTLLSWPLEHWLWDKVWPFSILAKLLGL